MIVLGRAVKISPPTNLLESSDIILTAAPDWPLVYSSSIPHNPEPNLLLACASQCAAAVCCVSSVLLLMDAIIANEVITIRASFLSSCFFCSFFSSLFSS